MKLTHLVLCAVLLPLPALAIQPTYPAEGDARIRYVDYDAANVVKIVARYGRQTFVKFADDERIEDLGGGDTAAWEIGVAQRQNSFFIKPKDRSPNTNITVITNKRFYNFELQLDTGKGQNMYMVWFRYPSEEAKARSATDSRRRAEDMLKKGGAGQAQNRNYTMQGSDSIAPIEAWDDGQFTYLRFAPRADFPTVYYVAEDGTETLANNHPEDDLIVVHRVAKKLVLRKGNLVTCIFNESFDPVGAKRPTNTKSPAVERVIRGVE